RNVQRGEVVVVVLDLGPGLHREARALEDRDDPPERAGDRMDRAVLAVAPRQRDVEHPRAERRLEPLRFERLAAGRDRGLERLLRVVDRLAGGRALLGREPAELAQPLRERALLAEILDARRVELREIGG